MEIITDLKRLRNAIKENNRALCIELQGNYGAFVPDTMAPFSTWERKLRRVDTLSQVLMPHDIPANLTPTNVTGDGNCLFNSVSAILVGSEDLAVTLRLLTTAELYLHRDFYAEHPR